MKKRYYLLSIFILFLINIGGVNATDGIMNGSIFGSDISSSPQAQFYNNSHNSITTNFNQEFSYIPYYYSNVGTESYLSFNIHTTLQRNVLYSLTIYLYGGVNIDISNNNIATGTYLNGANNNNLNNTCLVNKYNYTSSYNIYYGINASTDNPSDTVTGAIYITFVPTCNGNYINIPIKFTSSPYTTYFYGYNLQTIGLTDGLTSSDIQNVINNSGLATANKLNEVNNSVNQIKTEINGMQNEQKETNEKLDNLNDNITNSDSSGASGDAENFFSNFNTDTFGLTSVITAPLELIKSVTSKSCIPLQLTLPFVNKQLNLPCLSTIYENYFGSFLTIYRTITFGFVSYWVCIKIFNLVKDFKNPEHDEIEVLDL